jgi:uncharacterized membrane protein YjjP (DUF1212 family)
VCSVPAEERGISAEQIFRTLRNKLKYPYIFNAVYSAFYSAFVPRLQGAE